MKTVLFSIFGFPIYTHGVVSALAILLAYGVGLVLTRGTVYYKHIPNFMIYVLIGAIIGARFWHVFFFQWPYYSQHPGQIFAIWEGGISILGGLVGGGLVVLIYTRKHKLDFLEMADYLAPAVILGQGLGRIACFMNGDAYGSPTGSNFGIVYPPDSYAYQAYQSQPLWPTEVWECQGDFVIFALLYILSSKKLPKGWMFLIYCILYSLLRFSLEYLRGDSPRYLFNWTAGQWTMFAAIILAIILGLYLKLKRKES